MFLLWLIWLHDFLVLSMKSIFYFFYFLFFAFIFFYFFIFIIVNVIYKFLCFPEPTTLITPSAFFRSLYEGYSQKQENKLKCIVHYFKRICSCMPVGFLSFERKVLPQDHHPLFTSYPEADFWSKSVLPLCTFEVIQFKFKYLLL